jgi:Tectonin domain
MEEVEVILSIQDLSAARAEIEARGGSIRHVLTERMIVAALPPKVATARLRHASPVDPAKVGDLEQRLLRSLQLKHKPRARAARRLSVRAWDTPGFEPPGKSDDEDNKRIRARSTNTPTSVELRGSIAVGIVMVSGPATPWVPVAGALKHVSAAADGTVWGVNASDNIYRRNGAQWEQIAGALKQVSVGSTNIVWGVNADDKVYRRGSNAWEQMPGRLKHVSAAADGSVWGVNASDEIYRWNGSSWTRIAGALKQISVGASNIVWGVNASNKIFRWNGSSWDPVAGALIHVAAGSDGAVWGVNAGNEIFSWTGSQWQPIAGRLKQLSVGSTNSIWGVNASDVIYNRGSSGFDLSAAQRSTIMAEVMEGLAFLASADPDAKITFNYDWREIEVDAGAGTDSGYEAKESPWRDAALKKMGFTPSRQGSVDYVNALRASRKTDWAYVAYFTRYPLHHFGYASGERLVMHYDNDGWGPGAINQVFAHETCHIFGAADEYEKSECSCGGSGHSDTPNLNCFFCTKTQAACLMNANTLTLCPWSRGQLGWSMWQNIGGALIHVSASADGTVWGCNASNQIYRRDGAAWTRISGALKQISVGRSGVVWGVNASDKIYRWNGTGWTQVAGSLRHVSVASDGTVWGVNADHKIFRWNGSSWTQVAGALKQISVGSASLVWGVNASDNIYRWSGSAWQQQPGKLKHVSVAADGTVWGVNSADKIYRWTGSAWNQVPGALAQISAGSASQIWGVNVGQKIYRLK